MTNDELVEVIDALALALADEGHKWSPELRKGYEAAIKFLTTAAAGRVHIHVHEKPDETKGVPVRPRARVRRS